MTETMEIVEEKETRVSKNSTDDQFLTDPGNHGSDHFKTRMSRFRFATREYMTRFTNHQSEYLAGLQAKHQSHFGDVFFPYTALLGSHTFYVLFLPMPVWFGHYELTRDLVYILGYSIYLSGFLKDYWCLPRPRSPPVKRSTLSDYTAKEYGAPSSHAANATGASIYFLYCIWACAPFSLTYKILFTLLTCFYYFSLVVGRVYCGMHGMLDLTAGIACGVVCVAGRLLLSYVFRDFRSGETWWFPLVSVAVGLTLLFKHIRPIDECPCFVDSVAFIGVASGYECGDWFLQKFLPMLSCGGYSTDGPIVLLRPFVAVPVIVLWKNVISKPLVYNVFLKVIGFPDDRATVLQKREQKFNDPVCSLYIGEPKIEIVGRYIIYAGIPIATTVVCPLVLKLVGLA
ncbi:sphinganine kinase YSR3 KNAG_0C01280 [Huiozyma naganishii CBS 8797]|uniref:Phosphatidic acid phosphatase type 2/haloperoxidase domain-containing protein n=1 Tax=Huiozyma naganishii (strain ATCC MYA-139 / BCRC 22969 / CBS 8797 / KCTC 17520 / NBRC 10181 / NCYC 3082 / Yp74L-3) TaxID=1071383 RepID=J7S5M3_HUIN7|nr:hypothetical protein KNAG_0C01280 [Kazachstania naganishii CBS 8797]CCK69241.1 hypothetical protein KNAG_0C01280 [Kazachstania naganishii CBS 8797]